MAPLPNFVVTGNIKEVLGTVTAGELDEAALTRAQVVFKSNMPDDQFLTWEGELKWSDNIVQAFVDTNGDLVDENGDPVHLLAQDDGLNVRGLQWQVRITIPRSALPPAPAGAVRTFWFNAPGDGATIDLIEVVPVVGTRIHGVTPGGGDMLKALYDPDNVGSDAFDFANFHGVFSAIQITDSTAFGRSLLTSANAAAGRTALDTDSVYQAKDTELEAIAGLTSAANKLPYFTGSGTAALTDFSAFARTLLDDADAAAMRTTLGISAGGDASTNTSVSVDSEVVLFSGTTGKTLKRASISGIPKLTSGVLSAATAGTDYYAPSGTDVAVADGGTGASNAAGARTNLGLVIGTDIQAQDAELQAIAGLTSAADRLPYFTGSGTAALATFTAAGRALVDDADATAQRATLGLVIGTNVQAQDAELQAIAGLVSAADKLPYFTGSGTAALADFSAFARTLLDDADAAAMRATLGVGTGGGDASTNTATSVDSEVVLFSGTAGKTLKRATGSGIPKLTSGVLGFAVAGTDYQAADAELTAIAGLTSAANKLPYFTGSGTAALADLTSFGRSLIDDADAATARTTLLAERAFRINVLDYGADNTGATGDLGAIITARAAALHTAGGGIIYVPAGTYKFTTTGTIDSPKVSLVGAGSGSTKFVPASGLGTATCLDISGQTTSSGDYGPKIGGFQIDGTATPSGVGLTYGDLVRGHLDDIFIDNYATGKALRFLNRVVWTERTLLTRVTLGDNNKIGWAFEVSGGGTSFGYTRAIDCALNLAAVSNTTTVASVTTTAGSTTATVASGGFPSVTTGMSVDGTNLYGGTTVSAVASNTLTLSIPAKASGTATLSFAANNQIGIYVGATAYLYNGTLNLIANISGGTAGTNQSPVLFKIENGGFVEYMDFGIDAETPAGAGKATALWVGNSSTMICWGYTALGPTPWANTNYVSATAAAVRLADNAHWGFLANPAGPASLHAITDGNLKMFRGRYYNEAYDRLQISDDGSLYFGDGTATPDTHVYRFGSAGLQIDSRVRSGEFKALQTSGTNNAYDSLVSGDANNRLAIDANGKHSWGDGTNAADTTLYRSAADTLKTDDNLIVAAPGTASGSVLTVDGTQTETNKRITKRVTQLSNPGATPTWNSNNCDCLEITGEVAAITSMTSGHTGTPTNFQPLTVAITATGTIAIAWGSLFENGPATLPTTTSGTQRLDAQFEWNAVTSKFRCMAWGSA